MLVFPSAFFLRRRALPCAIVFATFLAVLGLGPGTADAYSIETETSFAVGVVTDIDPGLLQGSDRTTTTSPGIPSNASVDSGLLALDPFRTRIQASAEAVADGFDLGVRSTLSVQDRDPAQGGESLGARAAITFEDFVSQSEAAAIFLSPILHLSGSVSGTSPDLRSILSLSVSSPGFTDLFTFDTIFDGPATTVDQQVLGPALPVPPGASILLRIQLSAQTGRSYSVIGPGDHQGSVDFLGTASLLGFAAFADAEMTQPLPDVVVSSDDGITYATLTVPEPATALLLALGLAAGLGASRGRTPGRRDSQGD